MVVIPNVGEAEASPSDESFQASSGGPWRC